MEAGMHKVLRGLSIGYLLVAAAFGGALIEHGLLSAPAVGAKRFHSGSAKHPVPEALPLRGSQDIDAPLFLPFETPGAPRKSPARKRPSAATQLAAAPLLDTDAGAG